MKKLCTFNLANGQPNDLVMVNPELVRALTPNSETTTKIWFSCDDFWIVLGRLYDVRSVLLHYSGPEPLSTQRQAEKLETAFGKGQP